MDAHPRPDDAAVQFGILGPLRVVADGREVGLASRRQRALLAGLVIDAGSVVSTDLLGDLLWGHHPPADPAATIQTHVSRVRQTLVASAAEAARSLIVTRPGGYLLDVTPSQVDARRFEALVRDAREATDPAAAEVASAAALALWRDDPLPELDHREVDAEVVRLQELRLAALEIRATAQLRTGRHDQVVIDLEALVVRHPLRERLRGLLMVALYRSGRQADALSQFREARDVLVGELGVEPSPMLRRLELEILQQAEDVSWPLAGVESDTAAPARRGQPRLDPPQRPADPPTRFIGREREVPGVAAALERSRLVTLVGVGGVGKSRLAERVVAEVAATDHDSVRWCDLAQASLPDEVAEVVATALGALPSDDSGTDDSIVELLGRQELVLVLDNCEHVLGATSDLADRVVRWCPGVTVLATSRHPLRVAGEQIWPVDPLPVESGAGSAVELFCDRANAADPGFDIDEGHRDAVLEICRQLDGLPLAVELAAVRIRAMAPADILDRLGRRFEILTDGSRSTPVRHRSLDAVVDWSYSTLASSTQRLFDRLSVFAGGVDLAAAEQVCADDLLPLDEVAARVAELVDHSLLIATRRGGRARFRLLETLRLLGAERLAASGEVETWQRRHAVHFAAVAAAAAEGARGPDEAGWVRTIDAELANLRAANAWARSHGEVDLALQLAADLTWYAYQRLRDEVFSWAVRALEMPGASRSPARPAALVAAGVGRLQHGDLEQAIALGEQALDAGAPAQFRLRARQLLAEAALYQGRLDDTDHQASALVEEAGAVGDRYHEALGHLLGVLAAAYAGRDVDTRLDDARRIALAARTPSLSAGYWYMEGETRMDADPAAARAALERSIEIARSVGDRFNEGVARVSLASLEARHGRPRHALSAFREIVGHWRTSGDWAHMWTTLRNLVVLLARVDAEEPASVLLGAIETADTGASAFGDDALRLAATASSLRTTMGDAAFTAAVRRGRAMTDDDAVDHALASIDRLLSGPAPTRTPWRAR